MLAKLVVEKFESGVTKKKALEIIIEDYDNGSSDVRYGEWTSGWALRKKKYKEKSARLVVKIESGRESSILDLDKCAIEVENVMTETVVNNMNNITQKGYKSYGTGYQSAEAEDSSASFCLALPVTETETNYHIEDHIARRKPVLYQLDTVDAPAADDVERGITSLEYSLEKVRENNARIMENIHMLNRTLNYTKKKETEDIAGSKAMRFPCNICGKCFVYKTGLKRHYSVRHATTETQPRWQVVWTCVECFQVWPRQDLAEKHAKLCCKTEDTEIIREIKTSSLLQCEFCDKVFTCIPRLLGHSKLHTTVSNYECNACQSTFKSYKAAELHWVLCPWLKMYYSFSLPKMWLCNVCDRKFKNYEQLYNHRYKVGHYMAKYCFEKDRVNAMELVVLQCELCAKWYPNIPELNNHRRTQHPAGEINGQIGNVQKINLEEADYEAENGDENGQYSFYI